MKKLKIICTLAVAVLLFSMLTPLTANAEAANSKRDSLDIDDSEKELLNIDSDDFVMRVYDVCIRFAFAETDDIDEILNGGYTLNELYAVEKDDNDFQFYAKDGSIINTKSYSYIDGEKVQNPYISFSQKELDAVKSNAVIDKIGTDVKVLKRYYLNGAPGGDGTAIYYKTNYGNFVYYKHFEIGECLFPAQDFCDYMKCVYEAISQYADLDVGDGFALDEIWDLSKYDINSNSFNIKVNSINPTATAIRKLYLPITVTAIACVLATVFVVRKTKLKKIS